MTVEHRFSITDAALQGFYGPVPAAVQIRHAMNKAGFKFEDDGKPSSIVNENPKPLGVMDSYYDAGTQITHYRQVINQP